MSRMDGQIHTETFGHGPDVVLVHGWGMHSGVWRSFARRFGEEFRVTLVDLPGHGRSGMISDFSLEGIRRVYQECVKKGVELIPVFSQCIFEVSKTGNLPGLPLTDLSVLSEGSITTRAFYEKAFERYQGKRMCSVGDIGESLENPVPYSINTLREMQILGMDPLKENWDRWTVDVREEEIKKKISDVSPSLIDYLKAILEEKRP